MRFVAGRRIRGGSIILVVRGGAFFPDFFGLLSVDGGISTI